jgi:hypothetical protein
MERGVSGTYQGIQKVMGGILKGMSHRVTESENLACPPSPLARLDFLHFMGNTEGLEKRQDPGSRHLVLEQENPGHRETGPFLPKPTGGLFIHTSFIPEIPNRQEGIPEPVQFEIVLSGRTRTSAIPQVLSKDVGLSRIREAIPPFLKGAIQRLIEPGPIPVLKQTRQGLPEP